jgi:hypothetical protein
MVFSAIGCVLMNTNLASSHRKTKQEKTVCLAKNGNRQITRITRSTSRNAWKQADTPHLI